MKLACISFIEEQYYSRKISRSKAISYLKSESFLNNREAEIVMNEIELNIFSGTKSFIGLVEMESLQNEYEKKVDNSYIPYDFYEEVLNLGIIPFKYLKKSILSP